jgi:hypothetical protein
LFFVLVASNIYSYFGPCYFEKALGRPHWWF